MLTTCITDCECIVVFGIIWHVDGAYMFQLPAYSHISAPVVMDATMIACAVYHFRAVSDAAYPENPRPIVDVVLRIQFIYRLVCTTEIMWFAVFFFSVNEHASSRSMVSVATYDTDWLNI